MPTIQETKAKLLRDIQILEEKAANERIASRQARSDGDYKIEAAYLFHAMNFDNQVTNLKTQLAELK